MNTYYNILELEPTTNKEEIKKAYLKLIKKYHPDRNNNNNENFLKITEAYNYLYNNNENDFYINIEDIINNFINITNYYYKLPENYTKSTLDINIICEININDIINNNFKELKIKRNINKKSIISNYIVNISHPLIIIHDNGDINDYIKGNLIIKLNLPYNFLWNENELIIYKNINLFEFIYGLNIEINLDESDIFIYNNWKPLYNGLIINIITNNDITVKIELILKYNDTIENYNIIKKYFSEIK